MSKLNDYEKKNKVIHGLAIGKTQADIAKQVDVDRSQISRFASKDDVKKLVEEKKQEIIEELPSVVESVTKDINTNNRLSEDLSQNLENLTIEDKLDLKGKLDKTNLNVLKIAGIFPTQSNNFIRNQVNIQDTSTTISPAFQEYMDLKSKYRQIYDPQGGTENDDN